MSTIVVLTDITYRSITDFDTDASSISTDFEQQIITHNDCSPGIEWCQDCYGVCECGWNAEMSYIVNERETEKEFKNFNTERLKFK